MKSQWALTSTPEQKREKPICNMALQHSHQHLPQTISSNQEDHDTIQDKVCFDFAPALLLLLLKDNNHMLPDNLVINVDDPTSMYIPSDNKFW